MGGWVTTILGKEPDDTFHTQDLIDKECLVYLSRGNDYYSVKEVSVKRN
jgi:hypothetical protein